MRVEQFEELIAWQKARRLSLLVYQTTRLDLFARDRALCDQIRRAAVSVMSNIAEGFERRSNAEFVRFLIIAKGSCGEVRSQVYVAYDVGYLTKEQFETLLKHAEEVSRIISGLIKSLEH